ncbi:MAG: endonuclease/exonuclease/phosphatase family protein [Vulcanimicrobiota bacterium]
MQKLRLATYNANNVFDRYDDPDKADGPPKSDLSLKAIAKILSESDADVVSLQEIENVEMLELLLQSGGLQTLYPHYKLVEGNDRKGIDVAVISKYPIARFESHREKVVGDDHGRPRRFLRDLLEVDVTLPGGGTLRVFSNHYVKQGNRWCDQQRLAEAQATARIVRESTSAIPVEHYAVMGDFNDDPDSPTLQALAMFNSSTGLPPSWGISRPHAEYQPALFDQILVCNGLRDQWTESGVFQHPAAPQASDHQLVWADFLVA